ncbi:hypothetical protein PS423_07655 [Pediococcus acidilactici]
MCTSIELTAENGAKFWGRTMDLAMTMFGEDGGCGKRDYHHPSGSEGC